MSRGNQREIDRQRAQKKQEEKLKAAGRVRVSSRCVLTIVVFMVSIFLDPF
jgi:4F5 protein related disordered region